MHDNGTTGQRAIAIARQDKELKAVELEEQGGAFEVLWTKSSRMSDSDWSTFAAECGLSAVTARQRKVDSGRIAVVGFDSTSVAFYHIDAPAVGEDETEAIVKMQAETMLPLPAEQIELAWRRGPLRNGKAAITIAAARKKPLQELVESVRGFQPAKILLDCEGIVRAWRAIFSGGRQNALVVSLTARSTQLCLVENEQLSNAMVLDIGIEDFARMTEKLSFGTGLLEQTEVTERFSQDVRSALESFGYTEHTALPVLVLSDGSSAIERAVSCLKSAGIKASAALPAATSLRTKGDSVAAQLYEYRLPIGLALMALERATDGLDLFASLYEPLSRKKTAGLYSLKVTGGIAAALLVLFVIISYGVDVATNQRLSRLAAEPHFNELVQRHTLIENVARQRPDLLQLLSDISSGGDNRGIQLDSFYFRKGQPVTITGEAQSNDQLYDFHKYLLSKKDIKDVNIQNTSRDSRTRRLRFTITFHYRAFTKKIAQTQSRRPGIL